MSINQIRHLQTARPFEPFAIELSSGRVIQRFTNGPRSRNQGKRSRDQRGRDWNFAWRGSFELVDANHVAAISVGVHPKIKEELQQRMERAKKIRGQ
jgi:hypothetical protein